MLYICLLIPLLITLLWITYQTRIPPAAAPLSPNAVYTIMLLLVILIASVSIWLAISTWKSAERRLEELSRAIDHVIDGDFSISLTGCQEGIISRLEQQFRTMSRRLQLTLQNLEGEKERQQSLVADISHQIKTPLASIKLYNSLIAKGGLSQAEQNEFLQRIDDQILRLEWLSSSLSKISRLETGLIDLRMEPADIKSTMVSAVNSVYLKALEKAVDISLNNISSTTICHDVKWTREALVNILENAIKYVDKAGMISISMELLESYIKIDIQDNGIGIPGHEIYRVFERFFRGESEVVKQTEGSGIGLYLSRKIIEEQGGGITLSSSVGTGTTFSVLLLR